LPFHMHLPLEWLDIAHLISAMLLEIPNMLHQLYNPSHKRFISKALRKNLENWDKNMFQTPPESNREHVICAAKSLFNGDWVDCKAKLEKVKCINDICADPAELWNKLKREGLRCYCLRYQYSYESLQLEQLASMFDLPESTVHRVISKMIYESEVDFSWDASSKIVIVNGESKSKFQRLILSLGDKAAGQLEHLERIVDFKTQIYQKEHFHHHQNKGHGFRDIFADEVRYFNRTRYAAMGKNKGGVVAGVQDRRKGKGKGKGKGGPKGDFRPGKGGDFRGGKDGKGPRVDRGWNRGARDTAIGGARQGGERGEAWGSLRA